MIRTNLFLVRIKPKLLLSTFTLAPGNKMLNEHYTAKISKGFIDETMTTNILVLPDRIKSKSKFFPTLLSLVLCQHICTEQIIYMGLSCN